MMTLGINDDARHFCRPVSRKIVRDGYSTNLGVKVMGEILSVATAFSELARGGAD